MFDHVSSDTVRIPSYKFEGSTLVKTSSLIDKADYSISDGKYLIEYSDTQSIKELTLLPGNKLRIDWGKYPLDCEVDDVNIIGKVIMTMVVNA